MIGLIVAAIVASSAPVAPAPADHTPPCLFDEATGVRCVWDARHMGNGIGHSFVAHRDETVTYVTHRRAHRLAVTNR